MIRALVSGTLHADPQARTFLRAHKPALVALVEGDGDAKSRDTNRLNLGSAI